MKLTLFIFAILVWAQTAMAHFIVETQNREIHVETDGGDARILLRFPLSLAYAKELANRAPGAAFSGPFMKTEMVRGGTFYQLDRDAVYNDYGGFARFLLRDYRFSVNGVIREPNWMEFAVIDTHAEQETGLNIEPGLLASDTLMSLCAADFPEHAYISDTLIILSLHLFDVGPTEPLKIELLSPAFPVPEGKFFETRITDHRGGSTSLLTFPGTGFDPVVLAGSTWASFTHFVKQGVHHILTGYDHVLFVLCLVMAAASLRMLVWSVTGFTIGHSITLAAGVLGLAPQAPWFIPLVELLVAVSILLMGALILLRRAGRQGFWLAGAIGLLHGFGFSFMLAGMLGGAGTALAVALAGFNIGVELGQLAIVVAAFLIVRLALLISDMAGNALRYAVAVIACAISLLMIVDRGEALNETRAQTETL